MDNILSFNIRLPSDIMQELSQRFKERRLLMRLTRDGLATRSGVTASSLKRFETTGQISLESLLKLSLVLDCLDDFNFIAGNNKKQISLDELLQEKKIPKRGCIK